MRIFNYFKPVLSEDYVNLSIGRVYFKPLTNGVINHTVNQSIVGGSTVHQNLLYTLFEYRTLNISRRKIDNLNPEDGDKVRNKMKEILIRYGIVEKETKVESDTPDFTPQQVEWMNQSKDSMMEKHGLGGT